MEKTPRKIGQYIILNDAIIGYGQSAAVYLAIRPDVPEEVVAIKLFHVYEPEKTAQDMFLREVDIIKRLNHPNIIRVLHVGFDRNSPYYVMDYARGGSLRKKLWNAANSLSNR
jgi:serine/threonine protein kinase